MQTQVTSLGEEMPEAILQLDLTMIKYKLMDTKEGPCWTKEQADEVEIWYKRIRSKPCH